MKTLYTTLIIALSITISNAQKLESGSWKVAIDKWSKSEKGLFGETNVIYEGIVEIYRGKAKLKSHLFEYNETTGNMVVKTLNKQVKEPKLKYLSEEESFTYIHPEGEEVKIKALNADKEKNIVLSGILIWLDYKP